MKKIDIIKTNVVFLRYKIKMKNFSAYIVRFSLIIGRKFDVFR